MHWGLRTVSKCEKNYNSIYDRHLNKSWQNIDISVRPPIHYKPRVAGVQYTGKKKEFRGNAERGKHDLRPLTGWSII